MSCHAISDDRCDQPSVICLGSVITSVAFTQTLILDIMSESIGAEMSEAVRHFLVRFTRRHPYKLKLNF